jgi:hypothetical protein
LWWDGTPMDLAMLFHFDNIKTVKTVSLIWFMIILPMVETMGYGRWHSDKAEDFIRKFLRPTLSQNPAILAYFSKRSLHIHLKTSFKFSFPQMI